MSFNGTMTKLADAIRSKTLTSGGLSLEDMIKHINSLTLDIDETKNMLRDTNDFGADSAWHNPLSKQVGSENSYSYAWRTPQQSTSYLNQEIKGAEYFTMYVWKIYAKADQAGDKLHTELWGGGGSKNFTLTTQWKSYISVGQLTNTQNPKSIYWGSVASNKGNISMTLPVLVKYELAGLNPSGQSSEDAEPIEDGQPIENSQPVVDEQSTPIE